MAQKVQFIVTVLHEPELLIFDEPFSGFDPINANLLKEEILALRDKGSCLLYTSTAFRNSLNGTEPAPIDGFTADQRFYLAYATLWAQNIRDEEIARLTKLDVHSLGKWRVNATLRNLQDFYDAFSMTDGEMFMPEEERVVIW